MLWKIFAFPRARPGLMAAGTAACLLACAGGEFAAEGPPDSGKSSAPDADNDTGFVVICSPCPDQPTDVETDSRDATIEAGADAAAEGGGAVYASDAGGCGATELACRGGCVSANDIRNCGACGNDCTVLPNVSATGLTCTGGHCGYQCASGFGDCADAGTGCTSLQADPNNCGTCGNRCTASCSQASCSHGVCNTSACCTNACTAGSVQCSPTSSVQIQTCTTGSNGCTSWTTSSTCRSLVCERYGGPACVDPNWAEWPVPASAGSYTDNGNGTVTDNTTVLVWQQTPPSGVYTQAAGVSYCSTLNLGGYTDWRLPSMVELVSIDDLTQYNPSIDPTYFPGTPTSYNGNLTPFWSSTAAASGGWVVYYNVGQTNTAPVTNTAFVRCVR